METPHQFLLPDFEGCCSGEQSRGPFEGIQMKCFNQHPPQLPLSLPHHTHTHCTAPPLAGLVLNCFCKIKAIFLKFPCSTIVLSGVSINVDVKCISDLIFQNSCSGRLHCEEDGEALLLSGMVVFFFFFYLD